MTSYYRVGGVWKQTTPYVNIGGTWKIAKSAWTKLGSEWKSWFLQGGLNDSGFATYDTANNFDATVYPIVIQSDGKMLIGGTFGAFNGTATRIVRLNSDGTLDTAFNTNMGTGANGNIVAIAIQSDGKILIGGNFTTFNGTTVNRIARLNSDGTLETAFTTNTGTGATSATGGTVTAIAIQSDGKIVLGGDFTEWNGTTVGRIVRLNSNGTLDTAFTTNNGTGVTRFGINAIAIQSDGKIVFGGSWTGFNGNANANYIARLNSNGTLDTTFTTNTGTSFNTTVIAIAIQSDGKIICGGFFQTFNGTTVNRIARLNSDGTLDTAFTTNTGTSFNSSVQAIAIQSSGKILIGGGFTTFNGGTTNRIVRLNSNGTLDTPFTTNTGTGANGTVTAIAIQSDGKIVLGGSFTTFNGVLRNRIARLNSNETQDTAFLPVSAGASATINAIAIQSDRKIILGGEFTTFNGVTVGRIVRLNADGTLDTAFTTNNGTGASASIEAIALQTDGKILISGIVDFTTWNGSTVNRITRLNADGTRDTTFSTSVANNEVSAIAIESNGAIMIGGSFTTVGGVTPGRIARLDANGVRDASFTANGGTGFSSSVSAIAIQADGKIVVGGNFSSFNGVTGVTRIARLNSDGTRDTAFTTNAGTGANGTPNAIAIQSDGKIVLGGVFTTFNGTTVNRIARLNSNGTLDTAFTTNTGTGANGTVNAIVIQSDGKIAVGGAFTTFNGVTARGIVRLNSNGTLDTAFTTNTETGTSAAVSAIAIQSDVKLVIGGSFTGFGGANRSYLARIGGDVNQ